MTSQDHTPRKPSEILRAAREIISVPERWTQGASALSGRGNVVNARSPSAKCWCSFGAIDKAGSRSIAKLRTAEGILRAALKAESIILWNDAPERTHAEVLAAFDQAITLAEQSESRS